MPNAYRYAIAVALLIAPAALAGETLVDFTDGLFPNGEGPLTYQGITFTDNSNFRYMSTSQYGGMFDNIPGASLGLAFNDATGNSDLRLDFPAGTRAVSMLLSVNGAATSFLLDFFGPKDAYLGTVEAMMPGPGEATSAAWEDPAKGIAYVRLHEPGGGDGHPTLMDDIRYGDEGQVCYADFTGDGALDLFDFLAFVNAFNAADESADCDANGAFDLFDFLCFTNAFNAGC